MLQIDALRRGGLAAYVPPSWGRVELRGQLCLNVAQDLIAEGAWVLRLLVRCLRVAAGRRVVP